MIHRLRIRTGWLPEWVNCYLLDGDPLTLVDTGPATDEAWQDLEEGLAAMGRRVAELRRIIITHAHVDHCGQAQRIADAAHCPVLAPAGEHGQMTTAYVSLLANGGAAALRRTYVPLGMPPALLALLLDNLTLLDRMRAPVRSPEVLAAPVEIRDGAAKRATTRRFEVVATPGHSRGHACLFERESGVLLAGDHVLVAKRLPNPLLEGTPPGEPRRAALADYLESLARVRSLPLTRILPGHFDAIDDPAQAVDALTARCEDRATRVAAQLDSEPRSAFDIASTLYPHVPQRFFLLPISLVAGCLDLLARRNLAMRAPDKDGVERWIIPRDRAASACTGTTRPLGEFPRQSSAG